MVDQRELERLARQGAADIRSGKKKDWEVAQELQAAATGQSQGVEELKGIEGRLAQQGPDGITMIDQSRARGLGIPMQPGASATHSNIGANPEALKIEQMRRANNPTQAESMQRMNSQQPPSGAFGGDSLPWVMQTQPREIFRDLPNRRAMMPNQGGGQYVVTQTPNGVELNTPSNPQVAPSNLPNPKTQEFNTFLPKIQRGQPGFMDYLEGAGRGLQSMGKGMSGYAEKLFNDPNRMAMLQGGLSMMNPNSYYDQQGFGSVFQGLETGLGQAQKGMKGVLDRRKAISDQALVDAKAGAEGTNAQKFKSAQIGDSTYMYSDADIIRRRNELMAGGKLGWQKATNQAILEVGTKIDKGISPNKKSDIQFEYEQGDVRVNDIDQAIKLAEDATNTGFLGMGKRGYDAARGFFSVEGETTEATALVNSINHITSQNWKELVGSGQLSTGDKLFLEKVIHTPDNVFTTASEIRTSLKKLRKIQQKAQMGRAKQLGIPYSEAIKEPSKRLKSGEEYDSFIEKFNK